jgi:hypothetical protein
MFGTGTRFAEYGITGGFFILLQLLVLGWAIPGGVALALQFSAALLANLNERDLAPLFPAIQSLSVALALLSVFIIGLLLDLTGGIFVLWEARLFRVHLIRNRKWIVRLIEADLPDRKRDYVRFLTLLDSISPRGLRSYFYSPIPFLRASERRRRSRYSVRLVRRMQQAFRQLEASLIAKVVVAGVKTDLLGEQTSISRMSRAITFAIFLSGFEVYLVTFLPLTWRGDFADVFSFGLRFWVAALIPVFAVLFAVIIGRAAYSRFCLILFSQVYAISRLSKPS